jgi:Cft2 family RNA processing exonuclease
MSTDDMRAANARLHHVQTSEAMAAYGDGVRQQIIAFLQSNNTAAFDRVVPAHYGGEVTVLELLTIILSHSTHHLKQAYWFIDHELGVTLLKPATDADLEGIATPAALF